MSSNQRIFEWMETLPTCLEGQSPPIVTPSPGATSPIERQIMRLQLDEEGFERRSLTIDNPPTPESTQLCFILADISDGEGILPLSQRDEILRSLDVQETGLRRWKHSFKDSVQFEKLPGRIPDIREIKGILKRATECHTLDHEGASWNEEVHRFLLASIFPGPHDSQEGLFNFTTCDSARIDESMRNQLVALSQTLTLSANHLVDVPRLQLRPIVLSIETKEPSQSFSAAEVQMGVWHAAQWAFLRRTITMLSESTSERLSDDECEDQAEKALSELAFIPGIIVHGHRWFFVLSTRGEGKKMLLWTEYEFGDTLSIRSIYQVVAGLRVLTSWAETTFMPWFQRTVLAHVKT